MKKNRLGILLLLLLIAAAVWIFLKEDKSLKVAQDFKDFAIEDTASIDRIFISNLTGSKVLISRREDGVWRVEGKYKAREDAIKLILKTAYNIEIQAPVGESYLPSVISRMATNATKVEFYAGEDEPLKVWYVGHPTGSLVGTYMLLEKDGDKSDKPYITHMPMEKGSLGTRFFMDPILWRDRAMFRIQPEQIASIEVKHAYDTATSFRIDNLGQAKFQISNLESGEISPLPENLAIPYFKNFGGIYYEYIDTKSPANLIDSIYGSIPRHEIKISARDGKTVLIKTFNMPVRKGATLLGKPLYFNPERMYAYSSELGDEAHAIVQNLTFDLLVPDYQFFASSTTVEK